MSPLPVVKSNAFHHHCITVENYRILYIISYVCAFWSLGWMKWSCGSSSVETCHDCHGRWDDNCIGAQSFNDMQISSPRGTPLGLAGCSSTHINQVLGCSMSKWNIGHTNIPEYAMPWLKSTWSHRWATCQLSGRGKVFPVGSVEGGTWMSDISTRRCSSFKGAGP